ncbi:hypothetical protein ALC56_10454 [Trachymyrmex septentrionalis]|uniref:Uncharacterized protein n=1 Tax=Trachymyrmex septentrionalis TaxID=34720 RepID=A0A195F5D1_9HYME|nr:hypothetical protein ALC56_10454 [Trachymyrmex septentrionalis]
MDFHHLIITRLLKEKFIGAFELHISHARHKLTVSLLPGDFRKRGTWSRRPREKPEELLELMTKRHFETLYEHPKQQFDDIFVSIYENTLYGTSRERIGNACRRTTSRSDSFSFGNETEEKYEEKRASKEKRN